MSNSNHWDSLAASLGAEIPPETAPAAEPKPAAKPPAASRPAASTPKKAPPAKSNTDWGQLASTLGIAPAETTPAPTTPPPAVSLPAAQARQAEPTSRAASPPREAMPEREESSQQRRPPAREPEGRGRERGRGRDGGRDKNRGREGDRGRERGRDRDRERPPREPQARDEARPAPPDREHSERDVPAARQRPEPVDEPDFLFDEDPLAEILKAEAAESEESGEPSEQPQEERTGRKRRRRRRGGRRSKRDRVAGEESSQDRTGEGPESAETPFESSVDDFEAAEHEEFHALDDEPAAEETAAETSPGDDTERQGRPKRRRRRGSGRGRGGRGERSSEAKGESTRVPAREADAGDDHPEDDLTSAEDDEALGGDSLDDGPLGEDDDATDVVGDKNSHRAIPAWEEAIGYIVAVNMETRAKNPKSSQPRGRGRGRSSGRGAPRGGNGRRN